MLKEDFKKNIKRADKKVMFIGFQVSKEEHESIKDAAKECGLSLREYFVNLHHYVQV